MLDSDEDPRYNRAYFAPCVHDPSGFVSIPKQFIFVLVQFIFNELNLSHFLTLEIFKKISFIGLLDIQLQKFINNSHYLGIQRNFYELLIFMRWTQRRSLFYHPSSREFFRLP